MYEKTINAEKLIQRIYKINSINLLINHVYPEFKFDKDKLEITYTKDTNTNDTKDTNAANNKLISEGPNEHNERNDNPLLATGVLDPTMMNTSANCDTLCDILTKYTSIMNTIYTEYKSLDANLISKYKLIVAYKDKIKDLTSYNPDADPIPIPYKAIIDTYTDIKNIIPVKEIRNKSNNLQQVNIFEQFNNVNTNINNNFTTLASIINHFKLIIETLKQEITTVNEELNKNKTPNPPTYSPKNVSQDTLVRKPVFIDLPKPKANLISTLSLTKKINELNDIINSKESYATKSIETLKNEIEGFLKNQRMYINTQYEYDKQQSASKRVFYYINICNKEGDQIRVDIDADTGYMATGSIQLYAKPTYYVSIKSVNSKCSIGSNGLLSKFGNNKKGSGGRQNTKKSKNTKNPKKTRKHRIKHTRKNRINPHNTTRVRR